ncbi:exopolysaccharide production protein [Novosphingobium sp. Rr 2-17]|uniref:O-antigen ligase family protein n=1 Tax=Novosphingobium sp. Rr 2-17 TaxID=555793 RepID=UPI000269A57B|nr:O-antigen ligase family protein [Novosphingobium sp. Rr 2-17]EIZ77258.1 exopolysaccharide production protein [Novosphingobium sp. Rr 2-17]
MTFENAHSKIKKLLMPSSFLSFSILLFLAISTPFVEMSGLITEDQKKNRLYAYGVVIVLQIAATFMRGWKRSVSIFCTPIVLLLIWSTASLAWTQHIDLTGKRVFLLALVYSGIFSGVCDLGSRRSLTIVRIFLVLSLLFNVIFVFLVPNIGTQVYGEFNLWRGGMAHKNIAGMLCAVTIILFTFDCQKFSTTFRAGVIIASFVFLYFSWSKTALIALPIALSSGAVVLYIRRRYKSPESRIKNYVVIAARVFFCIVMLGLILLTVQREFFMYLTQDTTSLTGRAAIWRPMIQFYLDHPLLGSGYGAYWDSSINPLGISADSRGSLKDIDQGHNGYLDILIQVGFPGFAIAIYCSLVLPFRQIATMVGLTAQRAAAISALITFIMLENLSETSLFSDDNLGSTFLILALAYLHHHKIKLQYRSQADATDPNVVDKFANPVELRLMRQNSSRPPAQSH